jgi:predicted RNase H-like nuclease
LPAELDALAAAYTAWLAIKHPNSIMLYGDEREGQVVVPVGLMTPKVKLPAQPETELALLENE